MPTNQLPTKGTKNWGDTLNSWLGQLGPASLGGIYNGDTTSRPAGLTADDEGRIYIDTESQELLRWDGSAWQVLLTGNREQKFSITAKTADYTITTTEAETGLNGFCNDGSTGIVKFTLPDAVAGMKVTIINSEDQTLQIERSGDDKIYATSITAGTELLINNTKASATELYCINDTEWITSGVVTQWLNGGGKGYFGGGYDSAVEINTIDGLAFSTETAINPTATLSVARYSSAGVNSATNGYFGGGFPASHDTIDGIKFSDESAINPSAILSTARGYVTGVNSSTNGYFGGGIESSNLSLIDGIKFSDESAINPSTTLSVARRGLAGVNSTTRGYFAGGWINSSNYYNTIDGIKFSDESAINPSSSLSIARYGLAGANSVIKGYFCEGSNSSSSGDVIDGINFSDESAINPSATLSVARGNLAGVNSVMNGYFAGGWDGNAVNVIDGIRFNSETAINPAATLSVARTNPTGCQSGGIL